MTDGEAFLLVLVLIYLSDCLVWLPPSGYALVSFWSRRRFFVRRAVTQFEALRKGFAVLQPLPAVGTVFVVQTWPVSLDSAGLAPVSRENPNPGTALGILPGACHLSWDAIESIRAEGSRLKVNGRPFADCATSAGALWMATELRKIHAAPAGQRSGMIGRLTRRSFDHRHAGRRARFFLRSVRSLRWSTSAVFVAAFFLVPYSYWRFDDGPRFLWTLGALWLLMWQVTIEYWMIHRRFFPKLAADRWQHATLSLIFPQYAIRSIDALSKGFLAGSHPLAVAAAVGAPEEYGRLARFVTRDASHPIPSADPETSSARTAEAFRVENLRPALTDLISRVAPQPLGKLNADAAWECPRCGEEYTAADVPCPECGGLRSVPVGK